MTLFEYVVVGLYFLAAAFLIFYGFNMHLLTWLFTRRYKERGRLQQSRIEWYQAERPEDAWPTVTTQLPFYNEANVARRVIEAAARMDYPEGKHEIQVLDDSTDDTRAIVDETVAELRAQGYDVTVFRRENRVGYKAGALDEGLKEARGDLIAIFDADFVPPCDFLRRSVPLLMDEPANACVQTRWAHTNQNMNWLTRAQSLAIDGHFAVEQGGRSWNNLFMNFNGTAGIWRRAAIEDEKVGGWTSDTLTEDLDLSYRAQLAGWNIEYCMDIACPAELPETVPALKLQQHRWSKGTLQCARKLLPRIWRSNIGLGQKMAGTAHLTGYLISVAMTVIGLLCLPVCIINPWPMLGWAMYVFATLMWISLFGPPLAHAYSRRVINGSWRGIGLSPFLMIIGVGMCLHTGLAALAGLVQNGGEFKRTPKDGIRKRRYTLRGSPLWIVECCAAIYCGYSFYYFMNTRDSIVGGFLLIFALGFAVIGWQSSPFAFERSSKPVDEPVESPRDDELWATPGLGRE